MSIVDMSEAALAQALRDGAQDRFERAAVHLALATGVMTREDIRTRYLTRAAARRRLGSVQVSSPAHPMPVMATTTCRVRWSALRQDLDVDPPPLNSGQEAALRVACSLAAPGMPVDVAACLSKLDANLRLAASGAFRRALLAPAEPEPLWQATS